VEVLQTCNWISDPLDDNESMGSLQDAELEFELGAFEDDDNGSEQDVDYMERMMAMLLNARGTSPAFSEIDFRNGGRDAFERT